MGPTPAFVQGNSNGDSSNGTVSTCAFSSNVTAGNLLVVTIGFVTTSATATASDTQGNTYSTAVGPTDNTGITYRLYTFYAVAKSSGANTVSITISVGATFRRMMIHEYSGVNTLEGSNGASGNLSVPPDSGPVTTTHANALIFGWGITNNGTTTAGTGFTLRETALSESTEDKIVSSTGTYDAVYPNDDSSWICQVAAFYYASAVGPTAVTAWLHA